MALVTVTIFSIVILIAALSISLSSVVNVTTTAKARESITAFNAAEAGRDDIVARMAGGEKCEDVGATGRTPTGANPAYSWKIYSHIAPVNSSSTTPSSTTDPGVTPGCPTNDSLHILLEVKGLANRSVNTIVAAYDVKPGVSATPAFSLGEKLGASVYSYSTMALANTKVFKDSGRGLVVSKIGNASCPNGDIANTVFILLAGTFSGANCNATNSVIEAQNIDFGYTSNADVKSTLCSKTAVSGNSSKMLGPVLRNQTSCANSAALDAASLQWPDYNPLLGGTTPVISPGVSHYCGSSVTTTQKNEFLAFLANQTGEVIIDMTYCGSTWSKSNFNPVINSKMTIVANSISLANANISTNTPGSTFSLVTPDRTTSSPPTPHCVGSGIKLANFTAGIPGLIYTPCKVDAPNAETRGNIIAGTVDLPNGNQYGSFPATANPPPSTPGGGSTQPAPSGPPTIKPSIVKYSG